MNDTQLKEDFYKRFGVSQNRLAFSKTGLLCTLLGENDIKDFPSLSCCLSMCIRATGRKLGSKFINIENTQTGKADVYRLDELMALNTTEAEIFKKIPSLPDGAQILYDTTIPKNLDYSSEFNTTLLNTLLKISHKETDVLKKAAILATDNNFSKYVSILCAKKGWCTLVQGTKYIHLPLPLTGYKLMTVHIRRKNAPKNVFIKKSDMDAIKRIYPHVLSINDLTVGMLNNSDLKLKNDELHRLKYLVCEKDNVHIGVECLRGCNIKKFAETVNFSENHFRQFIKNYPESQYIVDTLLDTGECICARSRQDNIYAIITENRADNTINILRHSFVNIFGYEPSICICDTSSTE